VLEEVRDPGGAALLVARADAVPHLERDDGAAVILQQQHAEPVVEGGGDDAVGRVRPRGDQQRGDQEKRRDEAHWAIIPPGANPSR